MPRLVPCLLVLALLVPSAAFAPSLAFAQDRSYEIEPSAIDSNVHNFDSPNLVFPNTAIHGAPLVVFLGGAGDKPTSARDFLKFLASQGYPVIALEYDDDPGVAQACAQKPDPDCAEAVRRMRIDGDSDGPGTSPLANPPLETITARLTVLLHFLTEDKPGQGWDDYLDGDNVRWDRIVIAGLDEGAGMAAYIAKHHQVARVVLFAGPWDTGPDHQSAPWLSLPSATPMARWFGEYPAQDAGQAQKAYAALQVPADHVRIAAADGHATANPLTVVRDRRFAPDWAALFGRPQTGGAIQ